MKKFNIFFILLTCIFTICYIDIYELKSDVRYLRNKIIFSDTPNLYVESITHYFNSQIFTSETHKIEYIRNWVFENSVHDVESKKKYNPNNKNLMIQMLWDYHLNLENPPKLSCGPRSLVFQQILKYLNIKSRLITIFSDNYDEILSHTFLDVYNTETSSWELHDPDFNVHYVMRTDKTPVSTYNLVFGTIDFFLPVSLDKVGWEELNIEHLKDNFFESLMIHQDELIDLKGDLIIINPEKFDIDKKFKLNNNFNFIQFSKKNYYKPIMVLGEV